MQLIGWRNQRFIVMVFFLLVYCSVVIANGCHIGEVGTLPYCSIDCPCAEGEGDCDSDNECLPGLECRDNAGIYFGFPEVIDVCVAPGFNPSPVKPVVHSMEVVSLQEGTATVRGYLSLTGGEECSVWIEYGKTQNYGSKTQPSPMLQTGEFFKTLNSLEPGTKYFYRAAAQNSQGISYGEEMTFTTPGVSGTPTPTPSIAPSPSLLPSPSFSPISPSLTPTPTPLASISPPPLPSPSLSPFPSPTPSIQFTPTPFPSLSEFKCIDGTPLGQCSPSKPKRCAEDGIIRNDCDKCGCPFGFECFDGSNCFRVEESKVFVYEPAFNPSPPRKGKPFDFIVNVSSTRAPIEDCVLWFEGKHSVMKAVDGLFDRADEKAEFEFSSLSSGTHKAKVVCIDLGGSAGIGEFEFKVFGEKMKRDFDVMLCRDANCSERAETVFAGESVFISLNPPRENVSSVLVFPDGSETSISLPGSFSFPEQGIYTLRFLTGDASEFEGYSFEVIEKTDFSGIIFVLGVFVLLIVIGGVLFFLWKAGSFILMIGLLRKISIGERVSSILKGVFSFKKPVKQKEEDYFIKFEQDSDAGEFHCEQCGQIFYSRKQFKEHKRYHEELKEALGLLKSVSAKTEKSEAKDLLEERGFSGDVADRAAEMFTFKKLPPRERIKMAKGRVEHLERKKKASEVIEELKKALKESEGKPLEEKLKEAAERAIERKRREREAMKRLLEEKKQRRAVEKKAVQEKKEPKALIEKKAVEAKEKSKKKKELKKAEKREEKELKKAEKKQKKKRKKKKKAKKKSKKKAKKSNKKSKHG